MNRTSELLKHARERAGLSQRELASEAAIPQASVSRIERGRISPRMTTVERWLTACGMCLEIKPLSNTGLDLSLIRERLSMTPLERSRLGVAEAHALRAMERATIHRMDR